MVGFGTCAKCVFAMLVVCSHIAVAERTPSRSLGGAGNKAVAVLLPTTGRDAAAATSPRADHRLLRVGSSPVLTDGQLSLVKEDPHTRKLMSGGQLNAVEEMGWQRHAYRRFANRIDISGMSCLIFVAHFPPKHALCCTVNGRNGKYATCKLEEMFKMLMGGTKTMMQGQRITRTMGWTYREYRNEQTTYINLFRVPCRPPIDNSLCSQYVSCATSIHFSYRTSAGSLVTAGSLNRDTTLELRSNTFVVS